MRIRFVHRALFVLLLICQFSICLGKESTNANESSKYLNAVREFADNVLKYGRDNYGPKHTPLFVDGLNIHTDEPVKWISPKGDWQTATETEEWILSNFASQQTLLRTLDGLSEITGDPKYRQAAMDAIRYMFQHVRTPSGLFYWGHVTAYDALRDTPRGNTSRESIKIHYPYYELMWKVNPDATKKLIEALWCAHVMDWSNLDFNRIGITTADQEEPWNHEYKVSPTFFKSKYGGGGFFVTATSLIHAGTTLYRLSQQEQPLIWSKRLAHRYVQTRHPKTGIALPQYNNSLPPLGSDLRGHLLDPRTWVFPWNAFHETRYLYWPENVGAQIWLSLVFVGDVLGKSGREFTQWAKEELTAWSKASYRKRDNSFVPILTDGTDIEGYVSKEYGSYAPKGAIAKPLFADLTFFWAYAAASRATGNKSMWVMSRDIGIGNSLGDIGRSPTDTPELQTNTTCSNVYGLLAFLELYKRTGNSSFLRTARRIGDNILVKRFHKGFFVPTRKHNYTRFDRFEPLALLHLVVAIESRSQSAPQLWPSCPLFVPPYRHKQEGVDRRITYTLTESTEPPLSLQEAAAIGDTRLVRSLLQKGVAVDSWDDSLEKTALQRAAMSGHKDVVELLISEGARIDAKDAWPGGTALHYAVENGHKEIAELLITKGADVDTKDKQDRTPIALAVKEGRRKMAKLLLSKSGDVSLHTAAYVGDLQRVEKFIADGVDVDTKDQEGQTALHHAAKGGEMGMVEFLIAKGAGVNAKDNRSFTPLHEAVSGKHKDVVALLIDNGANVNAGARWGYTPMYYAAWSGITEVVELLVEKGADINVKDEWGWTPLHYMAQYDYYRDMAEFLIAKGADVNAKDNNGKTALSVAKKKGHTEIVELLRKHGAKE